MRWVIMVSHGGLAEGLHSAVRMMTGDRTDVYSVGLKEDMSADAFAAKFSCIIKDFKMTDEVILLADILSGSPFTNALQELDKKQLLQNTVVLAGMNMPLALTAVLMKDQGETLEQLKEKLLQEGHAGLVEFACTDNEEEEDL
ncbi:PTS sugar transporter subunit IIA [[Clostridium] innocuum]|nr:PTS sugar transporter subunit IIA [[Clostridium] innocuum]MCR0443856.1 PTS sugar transporter subunit IIA [[Clostridium] innocuum]